MVDWPSLTTQTTVAVRGPTLTTIGPATGSQFTRLVLRRIVYSGYMELTGSVIWECRPTSPGAEGFPDWRVI